VKGGFVLALLITLIIFLPACVGQGDERIVIKELYVDGQDRMNVTRRSLILTGDITVKNESQLVISGSQIQLSIRGEKTYNVSTVDKGKLVFYDSTLETLSPNSTVKLLGSGNISLVNSKVKGFNSLTSENNSALVVRNSTLDIGYIGCSGREISISNGYMRKGEMSVNVTKSRSILDRFRGDTLLMNVNGSTLIGVQCNLLQVNSADSVYLNKTRATHCSLQSSKEILAADSYFGFLNFNSSGVAINVSTAAGGAGGAIQATGNATTILRYWYLKVNVTEMTGIGIPARVIVDDYFGNRIVTGNTSIDGILVRPVLAEKINSSKTDFLGNYKIRAEYRNYTTLSTPLTLNGSKYIQLRFLEPVPIDTPTKLTISPISVKVDEPVKVKGWLAQGGPGEYVEIAFIGPNGTRDTVARMTGEGNAFETEFKPQVQGRWTIYADWIGGASYGVRFTKSQTYILTVLPRPSMFLLFITALPIAVVVIGIFAAIAFLALMRSKGAKV
jgi:hypothetical protein